MTDPDKTTEPLVDELNRRILETVPTGIATISAEGEFIQVNAEAERFSGWTAEALARRRVPDFREETFHEDGTPFPVDEYPAVRCLRTGQPQGPVTLGLRRPDGTVAWAVYSAVPLPDPRGGPPRAAVLTIVDITARKQAEDALRESEERLRRFFKAAFEGLAIHDKGVILDANQALADLHGYTVAELIGKHVLDLAPESRDLVLTHVLSGDEQPYEGRALRKDGSTFPAEVSAKNIPFGGKTVRVASLRDVTERRRAQERLHEYAGRLQALSARLLEVQEEERRHLARELHDQVGQSLTGLRLTLKAMAGLPPGQQAGPLAEAQAIVAELMAQVRDLSQSLRPAVLDDLGLLPALLWLFDRYTAQTGVRVDFKHRGLGGRFRPEVETGAFRIVQEALTNVARHAAVGAAAARAEVVNGALVVEVEDEGAGFDPGRVRGGDRGSGLSGMRERAVLLGGRLVLQSVPGDGTRLRAELPLEAAEEAGHVDAPAGR